MAFVVGFDCWVAFGVAPRAHGAVPLVAAAALVALVLVMAVAAAGVAMLVGVVVVVAVAAARGLAVLCERTGDKGLDASVAAALGTCVYRDAGLGKRVDSAAADAAADERVHAAVGEQARQGAVAGAAGAHDLLVEHLAVLNVVDLELLAAAKVHKDVAVVVRSCHPHGVNLLCWPCGRCRGNGGVRDVTAFDDDRPSIDKRVCHLSMRAAADCRHRGTGNAHVLGDCLLIEAFQVAQSQDFELVDRHNDGVSAGKAVGGKAAVFGDDPNTAQFFASSCHVHSLSDICQQ